MARKADVEPAVDVDMTPLIDVTFLLLVFFMMISVLNEMERSAELELPQAFQAQIMENLAKDRMIVNIDVEGNIMLFGQLTTLPAFRDRLQKMAAVLKEFGRTSGSAPVVVRADKECKFEFIRPVLAAIADHQFDTIMFAAYQRMARTEEVE